MIDQQTKKEREHARSARLDQLAEECARRNAPGETHLDCPYCAYLARFYADQRAGIRR